MRITYPDQDERIDRVVEILEDEGVPYIAAYRAARRIVELGPVARPMRVVPLDPVGDT